MDEKEFKPISFESDEKTPSADNQPDVREGQEEPVFHEFPEEKDGPFTFLKRIKPTLPGGKKTGLALLIITALFILALVVPGIFVVKSAKKLQASTQVLTSAAQGQDLAKVKQELPKIKRDLQAFDRSLTPLAWTQVIPYLGSYWRDAKHLSRAGVAGVEAGEIIVTTVEPYSDILGLDGGEAAADGAKTAEERINFIVETVDGIIPQLDQIAAKMQVVEAEISKIDPDRYPETFSGKPLRAKIKQGIRLVTDITTLVSDGKPVLEAAPYILGTKGERTYLFIWQNDKELRPTGGFMTAYSIIKVKDGKFEPVKSDDIYNLDNKFKTRLEAPEPIVKYLPKVPYWYLRDMNLNPDFKLSMDTFSQYYPETKEPDFDGVIAVDTHVLVSLLSVIGPIGVPGQGNFSAEDDDRCNCPQVIYELEEFADVAGPVVWDPAGTGKIIYAPANYGFRKAILGPLMNSIISNAMGQPKEKLPDLFEAMWNSVREKHVLFYFKDDKVQQAMESFNIAGRIRDYDGDYLHINDTNFAGAKSNLYVQEEVEFTVDKTGEGTTNHLVIKYKNPQKYDGWLNGPYRDWLRIYVPKGSTLVDSTGSEVSVTTYEENGKTVFEGFFILRPEGLTQLSFTYKAPTQFKDNYRILIQKQPGTDGHLYKVQVGKKKEEFKLKGDTELRF